MADILTLSDARSACRIATADTSNDADLSATYIPAVTTICESVAGPIMTATKTRVYDGGDPALRLPSVVTSVTSVVQSGQTLVSGTDYTVDLAAGLLYCGIFPVWSRFLPGYQTITVTYTVGYAAAPANVQASHKLAARIILAHLWQADQQGPRPQFGQVSEPLTMSPAGYLIPNRAAELLRPTVAAPGFA